jgi:hypothetical protein
MRSQALPRLNSLWVGERLGYLEQLCLLSARSVGHEVTLYSYTADALKGVPRGIELRDAREVMPESELVSYAGSGSFALGANLFRYSLLAKGLGLWIDMDLCFLNAIDLEEDHIFGWQDDIMINNAVLYLPRQSIFVQELCELPKTGRRPPWFGPKRSAIFYWDRMRYGGSDIRSMPWGTFGPEMVTYLAKKHQVAHKAQRPSVFYPVHWRDARKLYGPAEVIENMIGPDTLAIHMWYSALFGLRTSAPPKGSYVASLCNKYSVEIGATR